LYLRILTFFIGFLKLKPVGGLAGQKEDLTFIEGLSSPELPELCFFEF
jgi:hypothetical protein